MNLFLLTVFIAATSTDPTTTNTNSSSSNNSSKNSSATTTTKKNSKSTGTIVADPNAPQDTSVALPKSKKTQTPEATLVANDAADPASIVGNSIDAATQIANEAAKAALDEAAKLAAIGSDNEKSTATGSIINSQTVGAMTDGAVAVAKELKKPKAKKSAEDATSTDENTPPKPTKKSKVNNTDSGVPADSPTTKN